MLKLITIKPARVVNKPCLVPCMYTAQSHSYPVNASSVLNWILAYSNYIIIQKHNELAL